MPTIISIYSDTLYTPSWQHLTSMDTPTYPTMQWVWRSELWPLSNQSVLRLHTFLNHTRHTTLQQLAINHTSGHSTITP